MFTKVRGLNCVESRPVNFKILTSFLSQCLPKFTQGTGKLCSYGRGELWIVLLGDEETFFAVAFMFSAYASLKEHFSMYRIKMTLLLN